MRLQWRLRQWLLHFSQYCRQFSYNINQDILSSIAFSFWTENINAIFWSVQGRGRGIKKLIKGLIQVKFSAGPNGQINWNELIACNDDEAILAFKVLNKINNTWNWISWYFLWRHLAITWKMMTSIKYYSIQLLIPKDNREFVQMMMK